MPLLLLLRPRAFRAITVINWQADRGAARLAVAGEIARQEGSVMKRCYAYLSFALGILVAHHRDRAPADANCRRARRQRIAVRDQSRRRGRRIRHGDGREGPSSALRELPRRRPARQTRRAGPHRLRVHLGRDGRGDDRRRPRHRDRADDSLRRAQPGLPGRARPGAVRRLPRHALLRDAGLRDDRHADGRADPRPDRVRALSCRTARPTRRPRSAARRTSGNASNATGPRAWATSLTAGPT